jgi:hypothetical protein
MIEYMKYIMSKDTHLYNIQAYFVKKMNKVSYGLELLKKIINELFVYNFLELTSTRMMLHVTILFKII